MIDSILTKEGLPSLEESPMKSSRFFLSVVLGAALPALNGCDTGGEFDAPKTASPERTTAGCRPRDLPPVSFGAGQADLRLQQQLLERVLAGEGIKVFQDAFEEGNELFETEFTRSQGGGAYVTPETFFTRMPRADATCSGEWKTHLPERATGPNAQSCDACHNRPADGAGSIAGNVHRDPTHSADPKKMIQRNTPHLLGGGALQRLAEEMTQTLFGIRKAAADEACTTGRTVQRSLMAKGVEFGTIKASCYGQEPSYDTSGVRGVAADLVVRPFEWKKSVIFIRDFVRGAGHNEIGMQAVELVGEGKDGDGDGIVNELSIGQITELTVYMAAQVRPTTKTELIALGLLEADDKELPTDLAAVERGEKAFQQAGCDTCHKPELILDDPVFKEPAETVEFRDDRFFASKQNPVAEGLDWRHPISFDLTRDIPDNHIATPGGSTLGNFETDASGKHAVIRLYGDLKRHDMGRELEEAIDELGNGKLTPIQYLGGVEGSGSGRATFGTKELWGVGCTGPWLHDGRATTLREAIAYHGGEAAPARAKFNGLKGEEQRDLLAFLYNQVLYVKEVGTTEQPDLSICKPKDPL